MFIEVRSREDPKCLVQLLAHLAGRGLNDTSQWECCLYKQLGKGVVGNLLTTFVWVF